MDEYPQLHYAQSAAQYSDWMEQNILRCSRKLWIVQSRADGRRSAECGSSRTSICRMASRWSGSSWSGSDTSKKSSGQDVRIGWNPDSFGYNWQLPQIYKKSGVDYFVTQKMGWNDTNKLPLKLFLVAISRWQPRS